MGCFLLEPRCKLFILNSIDICLFSRKRRQLDKNKLWCTWSDGGDGYWSLRDPHFFLLVLVIASSIPLFKQQRGPSGTTEIKFASTRNPLEWTRWLRTSKFYLILGCPVGIGKLIRHGLIGFMIQKLLVLLLCKFISSSFLLEGLVD